MGGQDELVERARRGDEEAWAELYGDHADRLVVWLAHLRHADPAYDAEDIAAEAWLTAARRVADFDGDRSDFGGWLFGIARNVARSRYRATTVHGATPLGPGDLEFAAGRAEGPGAGSSRHDLTRALVSSLPAREAQVVACLDVVGMDVRTTSRALGISAVAVRVAHHRGLRRLRAGTDDVTLRTLGGM